MKTIVLPTDPALITLTVLTVWGSSFATAFIGAMTVARLLLG
jgi:hypothetical protein